MTNEESYNIAKDTEEIRRWSYHDPSWGDWLTILILLVCVVGACVCVKSR